MEKSNQSGSWRAFSYEEYWEGQVRERRTSKVPPSLKVAQVPVVRLQTAVWQIEQTFQLEELREEGIDIEKLLNQRTATEIENLLEELGFERAIGLGEVERLIEAQGFDRQRGERRFKRIRRHHDDLPAAIMRDGMGGARRVGNRDTRGEAGPLQPRGQIGEQCILTAGEVDKILSTTGAVAFDRAWENWCRRAGRPFLPEQE